MNKTEFLLHFQHRQVIQPPQSWPCHQQNRAAAVLMPLVTQRDSLHLLFTARAKHLKQHPGQISFPGGKYEPNDGNLQTTAIRETFEEVGFGQEHLQIIGELPSYNTTSNFTVKPFIGLVDPKASLNIDRNEVEQTFTVPVSYLIDPRNHLALERNTAKGSRLVYFIRWQQHTIWGVTAAFVKMLSDHLTQAKPNQSQPAYEKAAQIK